MTLREQVGALYESDREKVYSYLLYFGLPAAKAQDVTQDAFLKLYLEMRKGVVVENPRAWLYRVAHNVATRSGSREARFAGLPDDVAPVSDAPDPEEALILKSRQEALAR